MADFAVIFPGQGTDATVFGVLLTVESLLFTLTGLLFTAAPTAQRNALITPRKLGWVIASFVVLVAFATVLMWVGVFDSPMPKDWKAQVVAWIIFAAIVVEALAGLVIAFPLNRGRRVPPR